MSKKALAGGLIMLLLVLLGLFGEVTINGEVTDNRISALLVTILLFPLMIIIFGFIMGFLKDSIIAFFKESKNKLTKSSPEEVSPTPSTPPST